MTPCPSCEKKDREIADYKDQNERIAEMRIEDCERAEKAQAALAAMTKERDEAVAKWKETAQSVNTIADEMIDLRAALAALPADREGDEKACEIDNDGTCWTHGDNFSNYDRRLCPAKKPTPAASEGAQEK